MPSILSTVTSMSLIAFSVAFDAWEVLKAEVTCCPEHAGKEEMCTGEASSVCVYISDDDPDVFLQALSAADGNCLGEGYVQCQYEHWKQTGQVDGCCAPTCKGVPGPNQPPDTPPGYDPAPVLDCYQKNPTPEPTPYPTSPKCEIGVGYKFEGTACTFSGDPHTKQVNGVYHDFQGQPLTKNGKGQTQNSFYYVTHCDGADAGDMPFRIMATHFHWGTRVVSGVDYLTIELFDLDNTVYFLYFSSHIAAFAMNQANVNKDYDNTLESKKTALLNNVATEIGERFVVTYRQLATGKADLRLQIDGHDGTANNDGSIYIYMQGQMDYLPKDAPADKKRQKMHYVYLVQDSLYKCYSCGLCGNFKDSKIEGTHIQEIETCDGSYAQFSRGWNADNQPEAYDMLGWTYEYYYYNDKCGNAYDIGDNTGDLEYVDPCNPDIADDVMSECDAQMNDPRMQTCRGILGAETVQNMLKDCYFDACVIAGDKIEEEGIDADVAIEHAVNQVLFEPLDGVCEVDGVGENLDEAALIPNRMVGCYEDKSSRALRHFAGDILDHNLGECLKRCKDRGYKYAGAQYSRQCFCENDFAHATKYGSRIGTEYQARCTQFQPDLAAKFPDIYGCFGGSWTNCVYEIDPEENQPAALHKQYMSKKQVSEHQATHSKKQQTKKTNGQAFYSYIKANPLSGGEAETAEGAEKYYYVEMGVVGGIVLSLIGGAIYVKSRRNKHDKYIPIEDQV